MSNKFTNLQFVDFCRGMVGQPYWYGTVVYKCSDSVLKSKTSQYPDHYGSKRTEKYKDDIRNKRVCCDCVGLQKGFFWTNGGKNVLEYINGTATTFTNTYGSNGCPDQSADGMFSWAKKHGAVWGDDMSKMPDIPGIFLHMSKHTGVYEGGGTVIEARGFSYGVVRTKLKERKWLHWYYFPLLDYVDIHRSELKRGDKGKDVEQLQFQLMALGYSLPKYGVDGDFGKETEDAVRAFQKNSGFAVTGVATEEVRNSLNDRVPITPAENLNKEVEASGGNVWIRESPNTSGKKLGVLNNGKRLPYAGEDSDKGWHKVVFNDIFGWVSGTLSKVVDRK